MWNDDGEIIGCRARNRFFVLITSDTSNFLITSDISNFLILSDAVRDLSFILESFKSYEVVGGYVRRFDHRSDVTSHKANKASHRRVQRCNTRFFARPTRL